MKTKTASSTMVSALILALLVFVGEVPGGLALPSTTAPAFLWSPHLDDEFSSNLVKDVVNYQTISPKELVRSVLTEGGWSNLLVILILGVIVCFTY